MVRPKRVILWFAVAVGVSAALSPLHGGTLPSRRNVLTFRVPVALPNTTLATGTYSFELANPYGADHSVIVLNRERTRVFFMGMTREVARPATLPSDRVVTFGESARDTPAPITAWYPSGEARGYEFIYPPR
jgi:hypothetical protein